MRWSGSKAPLRSWQNQVSPSFCCAGASASAFRGRGDPGLLASELRKIKGDRSPDMYGSAPLQCIQGENLLLRKPHAN